MNKIKVLILGARGMLGNAVYSYLQQNESFSVRGTDREDNTGTLIHFDAMEFNELWFHEIVKKLKPNYIVNCIGIIRPGISHEEYAQCLLINSVFPRKLSMLCNSNNIKLIHVSTDCVFDGKKGRYEVSDIPNETSIYGLSKFLGETEQLPSVTIRTTIVGWELNTNRNLLNWFLTSSDKKVSGYKKVFWNGITTLTMAKIIERIITKNIAIDSPLIQVCSNTVSKFDLLHIFKEVFHKEIEITPDDVTTSDKTLVATKHQELYFRDIITTLDEQVRELADFYKGREPVKTI